MFFSLVIRSVVFRQTNDLLFGRFLTSIFGYFNKAVTFLTFIRFHLANRLESYVFQI